jgi:hypothetical protein
MDIAVSFVGKDGKRKRTKLEGVGVPRSRDVRPRKGESKTKAFQRTVETIVRRAVFGAVNAELGQLSGQVARKVTKRMTKKSAQRLLNRAKKERAAKFSVKLFRED